MQAYTLGRGVTLWEVITLTLKIKLVLLSPQKWKGKLKLSSDKEKSRSMALKLFPNFKEQLKFKYNHDTAEALLIGYYWLQYGDKQ